jgi:hypothetical protein
LLDILIISFPELSQKKNWGQILTKAKSPPTSKKGVKRPEIIIYAFHRNRLNLFLLFQQIIKLREQSAAAMTITRMSATIASHASFSGGCEVAAENKLNLIALLFISQSNTPDHSIVTPWSLLVIFTGCKVWLEH